MSDTPTSLRGVTVSTSGQTTSVNGTATAPESGGDATLQHLVGQATQTANQAGDQLGSLLSSLLANGGGGARQNPDGTYNPTPYNTALQPMMQTLGNGNPVNGIPAPALNQLSSLISNARSIMSPAHGGAADRFQQQAGLQAANIPSMSNADSNLLGAVNQSAGAVNGGREQMMSVIDGLNSAISTLSPLLGTATGQAGASSLISEAIQVGTTILTTLMGIISQISSSQLSAAKGNLDQVNPGDKVQQQAAIDGPYSSGSGQAPKEFYDAMNKALDAHGITDPRARANWIRGYETLVGRESGFRPDAVNLSDSNAAAGHPSQGYTQTIPSTFASYHQAGTSMNINDGAANIAASMNYVMDRYDVSPDGSNLQANVQQADPGRPPKGY